MSFVLDASAALAWAFERLDRAEAARADAVLDRLQAEEAIVPELWHLEVVNVLAVAERRGVIRMAKTVEFLARLDALPIRTATPSAVDRRDALLGIARTHGLTAYDATYLDLAMQWRMPLATFDRRLAAACDQVGVERA